MIKASCWRAMRGTIERWFRVVALSAFAAIAAKVGGEKPDRSGGVDEGETNRVERVERVEKFRVSSLVFRRIEDGEGEECGGVR